MLCSWHHGGGRIGRITLAENEGVIHGADSIEGVRDVMPDVLADTKFIYPKNNVERRSKIYALLGFKG